MKLNNKSKTLLIALCGLVLAGCGSVEETPTTTTTANATMNDILNSLRTGFTVSGTLDVTITYYEDINYTVPFETVSSATTTYAFTLIYQNDDEYTGVDRRFYEVVDGVSTYLYGENSFNYDGYVGIRYLDYDNTIQTTYAVDSDGDLAIYALNGLLNPFELVQRVDFTLQEDGTYELAMNKASLFYGEMFSVLDDYIAGVSFNTANFTFADNTLTQAHFESNNLDTTSPTTLISAGYVNVYPRYNYTLDLEFSDVGTSSAKDMIAVQPEKEENEPLAQALKIMGESKGFTYRRRSTPYVNGVYANQDQIVSIYYSNNGKNLTNNVGSTQGLPYVYSQTSYLYDPTAETVDPTAPSNADFMLYNPDSATGSLSAYEVSDTTIGSTNTFRRSSSGSDFYYLNGYYYEELFEYQNFGAYMDANTFDIATDEEGNTYYTPLLDNLQYIAAECFMAAIDVYTNIAGGYITDVRVYVEYSEEYQSYVFDEIIVEYNQNNSYSGWVVFNYYDFDNSGPNFTFEVGS